MNDHLVFAREFNGARLQDSCTFARKLEHIIVGNHVELARMRGNARVGRIDAVDIRIDLAHIRVETRCQSDRRRIRTTTTERSDVAIVRETLEACDHHDRTAFELFANAIGLNDLNLRAGEFIIGNDAGLPTGEAHSFMAERLDSHRQ